MTNKRSRDKLATNFLASWADAFVTRAASVYGVSEERALGILHLYCSLRRSSTHKQALRITRSIYHKVPL